MERAYRPSRRQRALEIEADVLGEAKPHLYRPQVKGRVERAMREFVLGAIDEAEFRARLVGLKGAYFAGAIPHRLVEAREVYQGRWATLEAILEALPLLPKALPEHVSQDVAKFIWGQIDESELRSRLQMLATSGAEA